MAWNPDTYNKFKKERFAPFYDLVELLRDNSTIKTAIDLGCGTGELTQMLAGLLPEARVLGVDSSAEMLSECTGFRTEKLRFEQRSIEEQLGLPETWDLIFSNAALQWVPDHRQLVAALLGKLNAGGQVLIQVPSNNDHYTHRAIADIALSVPFRNHLKGFTRQTPVLGIDQYAELLFQQGAHNICVYEKAYPHVLDNAEALYTWTSATALLPYIERLPHDVKQSFVEEYKRRLQEMYPGSPVFYPFKRTLISASMYR